MKQKICVSRSYLNSSVDRSSFSRVGSLFQVHGAATEKALSPIRRCVRGTTRSPDDGERTADRAGTSATDVSQSEMYRKYRGRVVTLASFYLPKNPTNCILSRVVSFGRKTPSTPTSGSCVHNSNNKRYVKLNRLSVALQRGNAVSFHNTMVTE